MDREIYQRQKTFTDVFLHLLQVETRASQNTLKYAVGKVGFSYHFLELHY